MAVSPKLDATPAIIAPSDILTVAELAMRLKVRPSWVYRHTDNSRRKADRLPVLHVDGFLRFDWAEVSQWLRNRNGSKTSQ